MVCASAKTLKSNFKRRLDLLYFGAKSAGLIDEIKKATLSKFDAHF